MFTPFPLRRSRTKSAAIIAAVTFSASVLAACTSGASSESSTQSGAGDPAAGNTTPITIPYLAATSGKAASYQAIMSVSLDLAKQDFSGDLVIGTRPIEIEQIDTGEDPVKAVAAFRRVAADASAIMGPAFSDEFEAVAPLAVKEEVPIISGISTITETAAKNRPWAYMTNPALGPIAEHATGLWVETEQVSKAIMIVDDSQAAVKLQAELTVDGAKSAGATVDSITIQSGQASYDATAARVAGAQPDGVMIAAFPNDAVNIVNSLRTQRVDAPIIVVSGTFTPQFVENLGSNAEGIYVWSAFWPDNPEGTTPQFAKAFKAAAGAPANANAAFNYEAWRLLFAALKNAEEDLMKSTGPKDDRAIIQAALDEVQIEGLDGKPISFNKDGFVENPGMLLQVSANNAVVKIG